jgi:hypothetical protein
MSKRSLPVVLEFTLQDDHPLVKIFHEIPAEAQQEAMLAVFDSVLEAVNMNGSWCTLTRGHQTDCGKYCPYPDTEWKHEGSPLPKCRGGDCTLCDELECTCGLG